MEENEVLRSAEAYVRELFRGNADGHDVDHTMRVYANAMRIAREEPGCDAFVVALAALLHDADDHKLFQTRNNANARGFMAAGGVAPETAEAVCRAINAVSFSQNRGRRPETPEGRIVQDADRLDAIGAVGIARTFAYGGRAGRPLSESIQHFYDKLLLLKEEMNTPCARRLARERHALMERFLAEYRRETSREE